MSAPQFQNASQFFRKPAAPPPKPITVTRSTAPAQAGLGSDTYAVGIFTPAPEALAASPAPPRSAFTLMHGLIAVAILSLVILF